MPTIAGRLSFASPSPYQSLQSERARMAAANAQAESVSSVLTNALGNSAVQLSQGLADLAAQQALARVNAAVSAKQAPAATAADSVPDVPVDPLTAVDEAMNGIDDLIASTAALFSDGSDPVSVIDGIVSGASGIASAGDALTDITRIIDGTADLAGGSAADAGDGASLFEALDSIINSFVPPPAPSVDVTA